MSQVSIAFTVRENGMRLNKSKMLVNMTMLHRRRKLNTFVLLITKKFDSSQEYK